MTIFHNPVKILLTHTWVYDIMNIEKYNYANVQNGEYI